MLEIRRFVFLSAVADIAKKILNAVGDGVNFFITFHAWAPLIYLTER
jgi:hypothetical protein